MFRWSSFAAMLLSLRQWRLLVRWNYRHLQEQGILEALGPHDNSHSPYIDALVDHLRKASLQIDSLTTVQLSADTSRD